MTLLTGVPLNGFPSSLDCRLSSDPGHLLTGQVRPGEHPLLADTSIQTPEALERSCHNTSEPALAAVPSLLLCLRHIRMGPTWCWVEPPFCWLPTAHCPLPTATATAPAGGRQKGIRQLQAWGSARPLAVLSPSSVSCLLGLCSNHMHGLQPTAPCHLNTRQHFGSALNWEPRPEGSLGAP